MFEHLNIKLELLPVPLNLNVKFVLDLNVLPKKTKIWLDRLKAYALDEKTYGQSRL